MTVTYIYTALTSVGGADRVIIEKANYFADKLGYIVYIITDSQKRTAPSFSLSQNVHHIDLNINFNEQYNYGIIKRALCYFRLMNKYKKKLIEILKEIHSDIVITTCGRELDFLTKINDGSIKIGESHIARPFIRNFHLMEKKSFIYKCIAKYWRRRQENAIKKLNAFVVLTEADANSWKNVRDSHVIPNSLPFYPQQSSDCSSKQVLSVGRYSEQKGYDMLIKAWKLVNKKHPDWKLAIYGEGELEHQLKEQIQTENLSDMIILHKPILNIVDAYLNSSIYVMSSRFEGFGMVLAEAMACGVPCVTFDCPYGPSVIIKDKEDGILVENGNIKQLAEKINFLIDNENIRKKMGTNAKKNIQRYTPDKIMQNWVNLFNILTNKSNVNSNTFV